MDTNFDLYVIPVNGYNDELSPAIYLSTPELMDEPDSGLAENLIVTVMWQRTGYVQ